MKSILLLTFGILISTITISQHVVVEHSGGTPFELKTNNEKNISVYTNVWGRKGYLGLVSGIDDMEFGTVNGNIPGTVNLTIQEIPKLTVLADGNTHVHNNYVRNVKDPQLPQDAATKAYVDANASSGGPYAIGDFAHGGVVFWVSTSGEHGKVVSIYDIIDVSWSNITNSAIGSSAFSFGNGAGNTVAIMMQTGHTSSAARHCADLAYAGYDDWYLPSREELNLVNINQSFINPTARANGGEDFADSYYWSSTEDDNERAWSQDFNLGAQQNNRPKTWRNRVRAIRAF